MTNTQPQQRYEIGIVGLGVMGRNLLLNRTSVQLIKASGGGREVSHGTTAAIP
jgi:hypothetical protein